MLILEIAAGIWAAWIAVFLVSLLLAGVLQCFLWLAALLQ